ncbi:inositol monophosphatase family protein [Streptomyces griseocarneus]|uniref:inositol monophosphatase family protein n=1 Tax=Streptomyces griseocarneus TaxID=51201 RepID=UPI00167D1718|nr:inositol monophosphatase family protein [Streptomyces griseocarneus]MBZ6474326.1 inositol monophosphatase [Streptomyces griseocarneus]GHG53326.1 inositol monophosphatase [Streptomyces griseocarneus]
MGTLPDDDSPRSPAPPAGPYAAERRLAVDAAREAGALLRSRFQDDYDVRAKGDAGDVVTDLDLLAERLVVRRIRERYPHDRILAEEAGATGAADAGTRRTWLVDPLDGSNNVVIGLPAYVVGVALCVDDRPVVGVVHDPVTERTWTASEGGGAYGPRGRLTGPRAPLSPSGPLLAWTQGHAVGRRDPVAHALKDALEARCRRLLQLWAPLLAWAMLARGDIDGFVGYRAEAIDLPAGALLAAEAGLEIRALDGGAFRGGVGGPDTDRSFVAGRPEDMPYLLGLLTRRADNGRPPVLTP